MHTFPGTLACYRRAADMRVVLYSRRPRRGQNFSIELIVAGLLNELRPEFNARLAVSRFASNGLLRRAYNVVEAALRQGDVNHITGDVHFIAYLLAPEKTLLTVHDCCVISGKMDLRKRLIRELWFRMPARRAAFITVVSHTVKAQLLTHVAVPPEKIAVVPSFVPKAYRRIDKPFNTDYPVILQVGTGANKNLLRLCYALKGMRCKLRIIGQLNAEQKRTLRSCAIDYEQFEGVPTEQMVELYASSDVVAFVSTFEGFGMPIVEGNLVGRPVVTSNVESMPEVAGDAACLVDPFDPQSIRAGIERVLHDQAYREQLVQNGFINAKRFEAAAVARSYEQLYERILRRDTAAGASGQETARAKGAQEEGGSPPATSLPGK